MQFLSKSQQNSVLYIEKLILKFILKGKGIRIAKTIAKKKKNKVGETALPEVKVYMLQQPQGSSIEKGKTEINTTEISHKHTQLPCFLNF